MRALKRTHQRTALIYRKGVAGHVPVGEPDAGAARRSYFGEQVLHFASCDWLRASRHPAASPLDAALDRHLIVNLAAFDPTDKQRVAADVGCGSLAQMFVQRVQPQHHLGPRGDHVRQSSGPQHLVYWLAIALDLHAKHGHPAPGDWQHVAQVLWQQHPVADKAFADQGQKLAAVAPRRFVVVVGRKQNRPFSQCARIPQRPERLDEGGDSSLHVGRPRPVELAILHLGRHKGQMHRVQVPIELQHPPRLAAVEASDHGRCLRPIGLGPLHGKALRRQYGRQRISHRAGIQRRAGHRNQFLGRIK